MHDLTQSARQKTSKSRSRSWMLVMLNAWSYLITKAEDLKVQIQILNTSNAQCMILPYHQGRRPQRADPDPECV
jgi:hypothetical protein